jgi:EthD domain
VDGVVELWFTDTGELDRAFASPEGVATMKHASTFIDEITTFMVETHVVV